MFVFLGKLPTGPANQQLQNRSKIAVAPLTFCDFPGRPMVSTLYQHTP